MIMYFNVFDLEVGIYVSCFGLGLVLDLKVNKGYKWRLCGFCCSGVEIQIGNEGVEFFRFLCFKVKGIFFCSWRILSWKGNLYVFIIFKGFVIRLQKYIVVKIFIISVIGEIRVF